MRYFLCLFCLLLLGASLPAQEINADLIQLTEQQIVYSLPDSNSLQISVLKRGTLIEKNGGSGDWIKIGLPHEMEVWVASCFLNDGVFLDGVRFRMEPTAASAALIQNRSFTGEKAVITGSSRNDYWKKVRIPSGGFAGFIFSPGEPLQSASGEECAEKKIQPPDFLSISADGCLVPLKTKIGDATHALIFSVDQTDHLMAYIIPGNLNLKLWEERNVHLSGTGNWGIREKKLFIRVEKILPVWR